MKENNDHDDCVAKTPNSGLLGADERSGGTTKKTKKDGDKKMVADGQVAKRAKRFREV